MSPSRQIVLIDPRRVISFNGYGVMTGNCSLHILLISLISLLRPRSLIQREHAPLKRMGKSIYIVDFTAMKQKNVATNFTRSIQCITKSMLTGELYQESQTESFVQSSTQSQAVQWYYMDDHKMFTPYTNEDSDLIEKMYCGLSKHVAQQCMINGRTYEFDFTMMKQINVSTRYGRSIQRKVSDSSWSKNSKKAEELATKDQKLMITLHGLKENLLAAQKSVEMKLKELHYTKTISLPQPLSSQLQQKLNTILSRHTVEYRIKQESTAKATSPSKPCEIVEIEGPEHEVHKAVTEIQDEIIRLHSSVANFSIEYPKEWQPQTKTTEVFELSQYSGERVKIKSKLKDTLPGVLIISIKRLQNKWLWDKFEQCRRRMYEKNSGVVNEKELFHGSRKTSAEQIYDSQEGFNMRFSSEGMWGRANYFAVDASYSNLYAYQRPDGYKELFLAKVLTGDSMACPPDKTLRMPPEKNTLPRIDSNVQLKQLRYDSVNGVTRSTQVFMTYSNDQAYPAYLIAYLESDTL